MVDWHVVNVDIPPLLGLDALNKRSFVADSVEYQNNKKSIAEETVQRPP